MAHTGFKDKTPADRMLDSRSTRTPSMGVLRGCAVVSGIGAGEKKGAGACGGGGGTGALPLTADGGAGGRTFERTGLGARAGIGGAEGKCASSETCIDGGATLGTEPCTALRRRGGGGGGGGRRAKTK